MKHKLLLFCSLLAITTSTSAQYISALAEEQTVLIGADDETVTRDWKNFSVTASSVEKYTYISKTDYGTTCSTVGGYYFPMDISKPIENIKILDFCFVDTLMFFCGYYHHPDSATCGIMGWLVIQSFLDGYTSTINYHKYGNAVRLNKLVAYETLGGGIRAVAIGENRDNINGSIVIEDDYLTSSSTTTSYNFFDLTYYPSYIETACNILLTADKVIVVGSLSGSNFLTIRYTDKNAGIVNMSDMYFYTNTYEVAGFTHATNLNEDNIAVAYTHIYPSSLISNRIRVINVNSLSIVNSQEFFPYDKDEIFEMQYDSINEQLLIMHPRLRMSYESSILITNPFDISSYHAPYVFHGDYVFTSFDKVGSNVWVSTGSNHWWYQDNPISIPDNTTCPDHDELFIEMLPNMILDHIPSGFFNEKETFLTTFDFNVESTKLDLNCSF